MKHEVVEFLPQLSELTSGKCFEGSVSRRGHDAN